MLSVADPLIMVALTEMREQRMGDEGIVARTESASLDIASIIQPRFYQPLIGMAEQVVSATSLLSSLDQ